MTTTCRAWCVRHSEYGDLSQHGGAVASAENVTVALVRCDSSVASRIYIAAGAEDSLALLPPAEARGVAAILASLGHGGLAALLADAAVTAAQEGRVR
jgi:hypothetical protein